MAEAQNPDICIIGGGAAGIAAAEAAAEANVPVVLVEKDELGGSNLAESVPAGALLAAASRYACLRDGPAFGLAAAPLQVNIARVFEHVHDVRAKAAARVSAERLTALGVTVIKAAARFRDERTVDAGDTAIRARRFIVAAGAEPRLPDLPGLDDIEVLTPRTVFDTPRKMNHLLVLGADKRGLELAQGFARLGVDTTVVDTGPALPDADPELSDLVLQRLRAEGVRIRDNVAIRTVARRRGGVRIIAATDGDAEAFNIDGSHLLVAAPRVAALDALRLNDAGIAHDANGIRIDKRLRTANVRVYAVGDCVSGPDAENRAVYQAGLVTDAALFGRRIAPDETAFSSLMRTDPALATTGLDETAARAGHKDVRVLRLPLNESDVALAERTTTGMIKVITTTGGQILGAAAVGREAGDIIAFWSLAIANRLNLRAVAGLSPPYPSRASASRQVAAALGGPSLTPQWQRRIIDALRKLG
ncbi:dihydrolipoyl dehydrogenase family protein [Bauldia sp.]|uniref:dihydrolipoyl dehydrogenase family protein n=1 Tax=Bauldia sp. TaxID=2575872 RepID=UPI003BAC9360